MEEDCDVQIPDDLRVPPRFVVKRWAKRIETPIESVLENNVVHVASVDDAPSEPGASPVSSVSSHPPLAKALTTARNRWDGTNISAGYRPSAPPLPKLGGLQGTLFCKTGSSNATSFAW